VSGANPRYTVPGSDVLMVDTSTGRVNAGGGVLSNQVSGSMKADLIAPYVYACWQLRWKIRNEEVR